MADQNMNVRFSGDVPPWEALVEIAKVLRELATPLDPTDSFTFTIEVTMNPVKLEECARD